MDLATFKPIGHVRTGLATKFETPSQPINSGEEVNRVELLPRQNFELALKDLEGFDRIWLLWWFDKNKNWRPRVMPPRGPATRRGVFSTRSPHRPNPIGLTCVRLYSVRGLVIEVGPLDLLDGTPIFDIKPYIPSVDCFPESSTGWLEEVDALEATPRAFRVVTTDRAATELGWLMDRYGIDLAERATQILERNPMPHRTRRILKLADGRFRIACAAWRLYYRIEGELVVIEEVAKGYSDATLSRDGAERILHRQEQLAFAAWQAEQFDSREPTSG